MTTTTHHKTARHASKTTSHAAPPSRLQLAFERCKPAMDALEPAELVTINVDMGTAITTVRGALVNIASYRTQIARDLPTLDRKGIDHLEEYALATAHAHGLYLTAVTPPEAITALGQEALDLRESLHSDATALARHGLMDAQRIKGLKQGTAYRVLAFDLIGLVALFREAWPKVEGKCPTDPSTLDRAESVADQLLGAIGDRQAAPAIVADLANTRQRAFTLLFRAYDDARRAVSFLRWREDDVESIVPSLYQGRGGRGRSASTGTQDPPAATPEPAAVAPVAAPVAPGHPGGSPFAS